jgi:hypothetical protein
VITDFQKTLRVDASDVGSLSLSFTVVLVETNQKYPLPVKSEDNVLKYLPRVFTATSNPTVRQIRIKLSPMNWRRNSVQIRNTLRGGPCEGSCECVRA